MTIGHYLVIVINICHYYLFFVALLYVLVPIKKEFSRFLPPISDVLLFPQRGVACAAQHLQSLTTTKAKDLNAMREEHDQVGELLGGGFKHFDFHPDPWENDRIWLIIFKWVETTN